MFSSTCATYGEPIETPIAETHPQQPINSYGETKLAVERALPHFERAYGIRSVALRYFNAAGADPDGEIGEDHSPEIHLIPRAIEAATGGPALQVFGDDYPTPDGTCLRDYIHVSRPRRRARARRSKRSSRPGASGAYNLGTGTPHSVREVIDTVERVTGRTVPWTLGAAAAGRSGGALRGAAQGAGASCTGRRGSPTSTSIVRTAWDWHQHASARLRSTSASVIATRHRCAACSRYARPYRGRLAWAVVGDAGLRRRVGRPRRAHQADLRQRAAEPGASLALDRLGDRRRSTC